MPNESRGLAVVWQTNVVHLLLLAAAFGVVLRVHLLRAGPALVAGAEQIGGRWLLRLVLCGRRRAHRVDGLVVAAVVRVERVTCKLLVRLGAVVVVANGKSARRVLRRGAASGGRVLCR